MHRYKAKGNIVASRILKPNQLGDLITDFDELIRTGSWWTIELEKSEFVFLQKSDGTSIRAIRKRSKEMLELVR